MTVISWATGAVSLSTDCSCGYIHSPVVSSIYGARRLKGTELFSFFFLFNTQLIHVGHQRAAAAAGSGIHFAFVAVIPALFFLRIVPFLLKIPPFFAGVCSVFFSRLERLLYFGRPKFN